MGTVAPATVIYPGAPLRAVAVAVAFSPLLDVPSRFASFQRRHQAEFDRLYDTSGNDWDRAEPPDGREFQRPRATMLMGHDREKAISVSRDSLAIITYQYGGGHNEFLAWALPMLREGLRDLDVEVVRQLSYRYENRIRRDVAKLDLGAMLQLSLAAPAEALPELGHAHLSWDQLWAGGRVSVSIDGCPYGNDEELRLNITAYLDREARAEEIEPVALEAHRRAFLTFEGIVTPTFRDTELRRSTAHA
jgi:hypothetical protein